MRVRRMRDVHGLVADAFQVVVDARDGQHETQVGGHQLLQGQQLHHAIVNFNLQFVDGVLFLEHRLRELFIRVQHGVDGLVHGALGQAAHPEQPLLQFFQITLKMTFHSLHPLCNDRLARCHRDSSSKRLPVDAFPGQQQCKKSIASLPSRNALPRKLIRSGR